MAVMTNAGGSFQKLEDDDVGGAGNKALVRAADTALPREAREALQLCGCLENSSQDFARCARVVLGYPRADLIEVGPRLRVDHDPHTPK